MAPPVRTVSAATQLIHRFVLLALYAKLLDEARQTAPPAWSSGQGSEGIIGC
jgi:hypothetical protein